MKILLISLFTITFSTALLGQRSVDVSSSNYVVGAVSKTIEAPIYNTSTLAIEKAWKSYMKTYDAKVKSSKSELVSYNTKLPISGAGDQTIYFKAESIDDSTARIVIGAEIEGEAIDASSSTDLKRIVRSFAYNLSKENTQEKLNTAKVTYTKLIRQQTSLNRDQERLTRNIERWKKSIADAELKQKENAADLVTTTSAIQKSEKTIAAAEKELSEIK
jgi:hypothetical protein